MNNSESLEEEISRTISTISVSIPSSRHRQTSDMIDKILEGLFISDAASVISEKGKNQIKELDITHILTTSAMPIPETSKIENIHYKFIFMMDIASQDLLGSNILEDGISYIDNCISNNGKILVHCEVGVSRSVTVVAGYLMKKFEWSPSKAILWIQNSRPIACPSNSFIRQLAIFRHLNYKTDENSLIKCSNYRHFCGDTGNIPNFEKKSTVSSSKLNLLETSSHKKYKCRKCRMDLFYDIHILKHSLGRNDNLEEIGKVKICDFDYLITPMKWMTCDEYQGKILCPKCGDKLGQYIWGGRECQGEDGAFCGRHVTPWVHIQKSKVDESIMNQLAARLAHLSVIKPPGQTNEVEEKEKVVS